MITNGYPWMRLPSADMTDQEQVERAPGIPRKLKSARKVQQPWQ